MFKFTNPFQSIGSIVVYYPKSIQNENFQSPQVGNTASLFPPTLLPGWNYSSGCILLNNKGASTWGIPTTSPYFNNATSQAVGFQNSNLNISQTLSLVAGTWRLEMGLCGRTTGGTLGPKPIRITLKGPTSFSAIDITASKLGTVGTTAVWKTLDQIINGVTTFNIPALGTYTLIIEGTGSTGDRTTFFTNIVLTKTA